MQLLIQKYRYILDIKGAETFYHPITVFFIKYRDENHIPKYFKA